MDALSINKPLFIVGYSRSGTTLLQSLVCTQENMYSLPETHFFSIVTRAIKDHPEDGIKSKDLDIIIDRIKEMMKFTLPEETTKRLKKNVSEKRLRKKQILEELVHAYCINNQIERKEIWVEKTPDHARFIDEIVKYFPDARFLAIIRNPLATLYSVNKNLNSKNTPFLLLARLWKKNIRCIEQFKKRRPNNIAVIRFEDLLKDKETTLENAFAILSLKFDKEKLEDFQQSVKKLILPHESWKNENVKKMHKNGSKEYENRLAKRDVLIIQSLLKQEVKTYNYPILYPNWQLFFNSILGGKIFDYYYTVKNKL